MYISTPTPIILSRSHCACGVAALQCYSVGYYVIINVMKMVAWLKGLKKINNKKKQKQQQAIRTYIIDLNGNQQIIYKYGDLKSFMFVIKVIDAKHV